MSESISSALIEHVVTPAIPWLLGVLGTYLVLILHRVAARLRVQINHEQRAWLERQVESILLEVEEAAARNAKRGAEIAGTWAEWKAREALAAVTVRLKIPPGRAEALIDQVLPQIGLGAAGGIKVIAQSVRAR